jgi:hypothetical protein
MLTPESAMIMFPDYAQISITSLLSRCWFIIFAQPVVSL